ncbi:hypothetical protein LCM4577_23280 [Mesorhizobium sp. LCM 4577]|uniref:DUF6894 domain-containing protein n=1 Tax=Mesorhizobium plurifarium TaxID=69974 RepID=A0A090EXY0_MESPL|nr:MULTISPECIES: hypothetical protein [unclassified Mesorhizobium]OHV61315.1 hypothetical protein LCM4576_32580 [Mesorhizobium sp. LCM 4576]OHV69005.1 hypothetical protein LCM4577_23280 [Mesorhizobium sp. LCM 4577]CDX11958.1 hypothetical protein MPL3356_110257 [Mesorhizobium plurifarium]
MLRFHFDLAYGGDVYHDAMGTALPDVKKAKDRAFEIVSKLVEKKCQDIACTVRDANGKRLMQITVDGDQTQIGTLPNRAR